MAITILGPASICRDCPWRYGSREQAMLGERQTRSRLGQGVLRGAESLVHLLAEVVEEDSVSSATFCRVYENPECTTSIHFRRSVFPGSLRLLFDMNSHIIRVSDMRLRVLRGYGFASAHTQALLASVSAHRPHCLCRRSPIWYLYSRLLFGLRPCFS